MNEINPIILALNEVDSRYIAGPKRERRFRTLKFALAAAAACIALSTAAAASGIAGKRENGVHIGDKVIAQNYTMYNGLRIPDSTELSAVGASVEDYPEFISCGFNALPSDVFGLFGFEPLNNGVFTEERQDVHINMFKDAPFGNDIVTLVLSYELIYKADDRPVSFIAWVAADENAPGSIGFEDIEYEAVTLRDGSEAVIHNNMGPESYWVEFSHNGVIYSMRTNENRDGAIGILSDLGII